MVGAPTPGLEDLGFAASEIGELSSGADKSTFGLDENFPSAEVQFIELLLLQFNLIAT